MMEDISAYFHCEKKQKNDWSNFKAVTMVIGLMSWFGVDVVKTVGNSIYSTTVFSFIIKVPIN